jgi:phage shock protein PspC (stress-responsive transcriptional regulator)
VFFGGLVLILALIYLKGKELYLSWIISGNIPKKVKEDNLKVQRNMSIVQIVLTVIAGILFVIAPYFDYNPNKITVAYMVITIIGMGCLLANIITFVVFYIRYKSNRRKLLVSGIRNILFIPSALIISVWHTTAWQGYLGDKNMQRYDQWEIEYFAIQNVCNG